MIFTKFPGDFAPLYGPLLFAFEDESEPRELEFFLLDGENLSTILKKRLHNTNAGEVNVAPLLRRRIQWEPQATPIGFSEASGRVQMITAVVEGAEATCHILPAWEGEEIPEVVISPMPDHRVLVRGEGEELFLNRGVARAELELFTPWKSVTQSYLSLHSESCQLFRLDSSGWAKEVVRAEVRLFDKQNEELQCLCYTLIEPPTEGIRLAWVSRLGSIEHYTFPVVKSISQKIENRDVVMTDGSRRRLRISLDELWEVTSAFEAPDMRRALSELATSQQVWQVDDAGEYHKVGIQTNSLQLHRHGALSTLQFTLCPTQKQLALWS